MAHQRGQLILASDVFYVRFYRDGKRVAERVCSRDLKHHSVTCAAVKKMRDEFMSRVNSGSDHPPKEGLTVAEFWDAEYLPYIEAEQKRTEKLWKKTYFTISWEC